MFNENSNKHKIQIGELIKEQFLLSKMSIEEFGNLIACKRENVYDIFYRERMDTDLLYKISKILKFDFFQIYSQSVTGDTMVQLHIIINIPEDEFKKGNICKYCDRYKNNDD